LLCLPFSNAQVERAFSIMGIVKDKLRNKMPVSTLDAIMKVCNLQTICLIQKIFINVREMKML
jgi:hypothetical protein